MSAAFSHGPRDGDGKFVLLGEVPVPESSAVLAACPAHSRAGVGMVSQQGCPGFCTILLGHYHLDKL